jgi:predicted negative regulator of RcsB-dependent stress response
MKKIIFNMRNTIIVGVIAVGAFFAINSTLMAEQSHHKNPMQTIEDISTATKMIQDKKYVDAKKLLDSIDDVDFYYLKNQHLGDIAYLNKKYDEALSFYNIAQLHAKDKVMNDYMSKKMAYIVTVKKGAVEKEVIENN